VGSSSLSSSLGDSTALTPATNNETGERNSSGDINREGSPPHASTLAAPSPSSPDGAAVMRRILESSESPPAQHPRTIQGPLQQHIRSLQRRGIMMQSPAATGGVVGAGPLPGVDPVLTILATLGFFGPMANGVPNGSIPQDTLADILHHILVNETSTPGAPPASEEEIAAIERVDVTEENKEELGTCHISQDSFEVGTVALKLKCGHAFNEESITQWLKMHNTCPVCRLIISGEKEAGDKENRGDESGVPITEGQTSEGAAEESVEDIPDLVENFR